MPFRHKFSPLKTNFDSIKAKLRFVAHAIHEALCAEGEGSPGFARLASCWFRAPAEGS